MGNHSTCFQFPKMLFFEQPYCPGALPQPIKLQHSDRLSSWLKFPARLVLYLKHTPACRKVDAIVHWHIILPANCSNAHCHATLQDISLLAGNFTIDGPKFSNFTPPHFYFVETWLMGFSCVHKPILASSGPWGQRLLRCSLGHFTRSLCRAIFGSSYLQIYSI